MASAHALMNHPWEGKPAGTRTEWSGERQRISQSCTCFPWGVLVHQYILSWMRSNVFSLPYTLKARRSRVGIDECFIRQSAASPPQILSVINHLAEMRTASCIKTARQSAASITWKTAKRITVRDLVVRSIDAIKLLLNIARCITSTFYLQ